MKTYQQKKDELIEASVRHRFYLLAKNDYEQFEKTVGKDEASQLWAELEKTNKHDTKVCVDAYKNYKGIDKITDYIRSDAERYVNGPAGKTALRHMKLHLAWALISHLLLLLVAICLGVAALVNGASSSDGNEVVLCTCIITVAHILLILDCIVGLSPRHYYICPESCIAYVQGWFKGEFNPHYSFTPALANTYTRSGDYEDIYRDRELSALTHEMQSNRLRYLSSKYGELEFHPSSSFKFIIAYIMVDIIHTSCLIAWMISLFNALSDAGTGNHILTAAISCAVIYYMLSRPVYATNRFHWYICRNLYAYKASHLFRKLSYSVILVVACIILGMF